MTKDQHPTTQHRPSSLHMSHQLPEQWISAEQSFDLLESISEAFYGVDAEWRFIYLNRKAEQLWGRKREDLIGKNIWDEFPHGVGTPTYEEMHRALKERQTRRFETFSTFLNAWFEVDIYPTRTGLSVYFRDIHQRKLAQTALEHSQQQLRLVTDSLPLLISYVDLEMRYQFVNKGYVELFGQERDQIIGKHVADLIGQAAFEATRPDLDVVLSGQTLTREQKMPPPLKDRFARIQRLPHIVEDGSIAGVFTMIQDITDQKLAEEGLANLAAIVRSSKDAIFSTTPDGIVTSWNAGAEKIFGYSAAEMIQKPSSLLVPPEKSDEEAEAFGRAATGEVIQNYDSVRVRKDGSKVFVSVSLSPLRDEKGSIVGVSRITQDITERKRGEEGLSRLAAIINSSNDAIFSTTLDGIVTSWNHGAEIVFGFSADEIIGQSFTLLMSHERHMDDVETTQQRIKIIAAGGVVPSKDVRRVARDGSEMFISISMSPLRNERGQVIGLSIIAKDITERKRAESQVRELNEHLEQLVAVRTGQLQAVNQELDAFAYVVSHDLKAPLRGITQLAGWLMSDYAASLDEEGRNMLRLMVGRSKRMHEMIEGILQYSRVGRVKESPTEVHLNRLVADVVDLLAPPDMIEITISPGLPVVYESEMRLRQVFQNLISNAIRYMDKPAGKISISCTEKAADWEFAIADTGPGIAPQYHEKIFQIFQTLAPRDEIESTGIGLALVRKIVEVLNGRIWLDSIEGQGTTFYFTLPKEAGRQ
jgi:two-component system, LuxR family, sensor kinase FixL